MIHFALRCEAAGHAFDGWFRSGEDFDGQAQRGLVSCPVCGSTSVGKALMRPAVAGTREAPTPAEMAKVAETLQRMGREVRASADYVGPNFAEEARRIHYGEADERRIYGEASPVEVKGLMEEGIAALPLPPLPEEKN
ncbi:MULTISPECIES: DUF1178 family protein [unclassified Aureimonas]|uniref:DUF1178 family protein n=1 Tax=unclassified Aureimonas TaxID=2615206 RepID=UPI0007017CB3|nr:MULTISPECIES: DUF1178 family protein [unclassified Aureimonas]KQT54002.1 hypothetical protein ASG62_12320 [Aureimonas sp. Leaf427]KQT71558.1 hypothetical protein ASG54_18840 [Aureimonas sp. Leaf460]